MRFNKKRISHWIVLIVSSINAVVAALLRKFNILKKKQRVVFYGHLYNGNLKAFYEFLEKEGNYQPVYLTMFAGYKKTLQKKGVKVFQASSFLDSIRVAQAQAIVADRGASFMFPVYRHTDMRFVDVWHGIPYKGWDETSFSEQKHYDEVWVSSPEFVHIYKNKYGFDDNVVATGYARTDPLINGSYTKRNLIKKYNLPNDKKHIILVAPTWKQDKRNRSIIPFNETIESFFSSLNKIGKKSDSLVIFRAHLNSGDEINVDEFEHVKIMPYSNYPVAEEFVGAADALITDWSSIAFDFLVHKKPVIYLNVEPPFEKGFTLDGSYRFGPTVNTPQELESMTTKYVGAPDSYREEYREIIAKATNVAYGELADGKAAERYLRRLNNLLKL